MKRSEMIALIALTMEESFDGDNGSWEKDAEKVLDAIEQAGMSPPFNTVEYYKTWRDGGDGAEWDKE